MTQIIISNSEKVLKQAKSLGYQDVYVPKELRDKIHIKITPQKVTIKKKK